MYVIPDAALSRRTVWHLRVQMCSMVAGVGAARSLSVLKLSYLNVPCDAWLATDSALTEDGSKSGSWGQDNDRATTRDACEQQDQVTKQLSAAGKKAWLQYSRNVTGMIKQQT